MTKFFKRYEHLISIFAPVLAGVIFLILGCLNLTDSIWFDESYSAYLVRGNFSDIWRLTSVDVHPPLFYFALKLWSSIFGMSDISMRFMSIFFGLIAIVFIFHLIKRWFNTKTATFGTLLLSVSPMFIRYGQEMRMYTMVLAIVAAATFVLTIALDRQKAALIESNSKSAQRQARTCWLIYAVLVCLGMWTHYFSAFAWLAELFYIIHFFGGLKTTFRTKSLRRQLFLTYGVAVTLYLPWIPSFFQQVTTVQQGFWIPPLSVTTLSDFLSQTFLFLDSKQTTGWLAILLIAVLAISTVLIVRAHQTTKSQSRFQLLLFLAFLPLALMTVASLPPLAPMFVDRYILYSSVTIWITIGVSAAIILNRPLNTPKRRRVFAIISTIVILATSSIVGIVNVETREPRGYVKDILTPIFSISQDEGEPIVAGSEWIYYDAVFYSSDQHPIYFPSHWTDYQYGSLQPIADYRVNLIDNLDDFTKTHAHFWYVTEAPKKSKEVKLPDELKDLRIVNVVTNDHHVAYELEL